MRGTGGRLQKLTSAQTSPGIAKVDRNSKDTSVLRNAANGERHAVRLRFRAVADVIRKIDAAP
jgi:hypothetical protein